jgi:S-DNA-T family DNA segregation ATPase FtsK/SpoIIIE
MAIRKNTKSSKAATPRNRKKGDLDAQKKSTKKTPSAAKSPGKISLWFTSIRSRWQNPRLQAAVGVTIMVLAVYLGCALISGLFTGAHDYALVLEGFNQVIQPNQQPYHNWLGGAGAHLAFWVGRQALGLGALSIPVLMFYWSWPMITQKKPAARGKTFRWGIFWTVLSPWFAGYLASILGKWGTPSWDHWIGTAGHFMTQNALIYLGTLGNGLVFGGAILAVSAYYLQPQLNQLSRFSFGSIKDWFSSEDAESGAWDDDTSSSENAIGASAMSESEATEFEASDLPWENEELSAPASASVTEIPVQDEIINAEEGDVTDAALDELLTELEQGTPPNESQPTSESIPTQIPIPEESQNEDDDLVTFEVKVADEETQLSDDEIDQKVQDFGEYDPTLDLSRFELPNLDLLAQHGNGKVQVSEEELDANKTRIIQTLRNFSIEVSSISAEVGPTVTLYEIVPAPGIRISKIKNLEDDIALSLAALGIRIIAPIPGRGTIGIEVPNSNPDIVSMRALIASDKFNDSKAALPIAMGKTISNETYVFDLAKMPHLLMAGATGQGKSVGLNAMLVSLLYRKHPAQLKFVLVDPKKVELTLFNHIERHYLAKLPDSEEAIITDTSKVVATLNSLCIEMDQRYDLLKDAQCRNLAEYNAKFVRRRLNPEEGHRYLPYIVLVVDEFADLIMTAGKEVETPIARLAQLARAIGIHLIIATQRPSVNIITGTIKANFPARIAFRVTSKIDSRTILDAGGADQLIGRGDMLMSTGNDLIRIQCGFVDTPEVEAICEFIGSQQGYPDAFILPEYTPEGNSESGNLSDDDRDSMFVDAARVIVMHQQGSTSLLQRKLKIGYNRAGRIIDQLEDAGIIGPFEGSKARKVLVPDEMSLEQMLQIGDA